MYKPKIIEKGEKKIIVCPNGDVFIDSKNKVRQCKVWVEHNRKRINVLGKFCYVSNLVAKVFIENPNNYRWVNHKDGDIMNSNVENLEWTIHVSKFNKGFYEKVDVSLFTHIDNCIYKYFKNSNEIGLYEILILNNKNKERILKQIYYAVGSYNESVLEDVYLTFLKRIKTTSLIPDNWDENRFIRYVEIWANYHAKFRTDKRFSLFEKVRSFNNDDDY